MSNSQKNFMSIRSKLLAAVAMLLVASFMVVSSTYAWFTLSTAPEVTGITTQVGANGNLEIALYSGNNTITSAVGDGSKDPAERNKTWGNVVQLEQADYGLSQIVLKPSVLVLDVVTDEEGNETGVVRLGAPLATPEYGADGRVSKLVTKSAFGTWSNEDKAFQRATDAYGVRALGSLTSMTQQQLDYANAQSAIKVALNNAQNATGVTLRQNGPALTEQIIKKATAQAGATYDLTAVATLLTDLSVVPDYLEEAMESFIIAIVAKKYEAELDADYNNIKNTVLNACREENGDFADLSGGSLTIMVGESAQQVEIPAQLQTVYNGYKTIKTSIDNAIATLEAEVGAENPVYTGKDWTAMSKVLSPLMKIDCTKTGEDGEGNPIYAEDGISINGLFYHELGDDAGRNELIQNVTSNNNLVEISLPKGSGLFADIASVCGNVSAGFKTPVTYGDLSITANVQMKTTLATSDVTRLDTVLDAATATAGAPADRDGSDAKISETYAYAIDLAFRTNAKGSDLMLQTKETGRIYSNGNEATMGNGSFMEFTASETLGEDEVLNLIASIRIVFVDTASGNIISAAKLDNSTDSVTSVNGVMKAPIVLCNFGFKTIDANGDTVADNEDTPNVDETAGTADDFSVLEIRDAKEANEKGQTAITGLDQNAQKNISVFVYLDGETVDNGDVATNGFSATGKLNLQFSSSADLTPMDYADLKGNSGSNAGD